MRLPILSLLELLRALRQLGLLDPGRFREHYLQSPPGQREAATAGRHLATLHIP